MIIPLELLELLDAVGKPLELLELELPGMGIPLELPGMGIGIPLELLDDELLELLDDVLLLDDELLEPVSVVELLLELSHALRANANKAILPCCTTALGLSKEARVIMMDFPEKMRVTRPSYVRSARSARVRIAKKRPKPLCYYQSASSLPPTRPLPGLSSKSASA